MILDLLVTLVLFVLAVADVAVGLFVMLILVLLLRSWLNEHPPLGRDEG